MGLDNNLKTLFNIKGKEGIKMAGMIAIHSRFHFNNV